MGKEEQQEEREVLDSIFPDEITDVSETEYRVQIQLDVTQADDDDTPAPIILLQVVYPENYPDEAPRLDIQNPPNAPKHPHLDVQEDKARLLSGLEPVIEENLGMAMVFTLVTTLKDEAELLISERQKAIEAQVEMEREAAEAEENRKFEGTKVTRETFLEWSRKFKAELEEEARRRQEERDAEEKKKRGPEKERKLTGRELWEKGLAGKNFEDEEDANDALEGMQRLRVAAA